MSDRDRISIAEPISFTSIPRAGRVFIISVLTKDWAHLDGSTGPNVLPLPSEGERVGERGPFARFWWYRQDAPEVPRGRLKSPDLSAVPWVPHHLLPRPAHFQSLWDLPNRISAAHSKENGDATSTRGRFGLSDPVTNYPKFPFPWLMSFNRGIR